MERTKNGFHGLGAPRTISANIHSYGSSPSSFHEKHLRPGQRSSSSFSWVAAAKEDEDGGGVGRDGGIWYEEVHGGAIPRWQIHLVPEHKVISSLVALEF